MPVTAERNAENRADARARGRDVPRHKAPKNPARKRRCKRDLLRFLRTYLPDWYPLPFSGDHLRMIDLAQTTVLTGGLQAVAMPRGSGKTTIFKGALVWAQAYGHSRFVLAVAADAKKAEKIVSSLKSAWSHGRLLAEDFPEACDYVRALAGIARRAEGQTSNGVETMLVWTKDETRLPKFAAGGGSVVRSIGITGAIRGAVADLSDGKQVRPGLVLIDDPQTRESAMSASQVADRLATIQGDIMGLPGPGESLACLCAVTVIAPNDLAAQILDRAEHPEWQGLKFKLMHAMPTNVPLWDQYAEILKEDLRLERGKARANEFYRANREAMDAGAVPGWPERKKKDELSATQSAMNLRITLGEAAFMAEYQNEPVDPFASTEVDQVTPPAVLRKLNGLPRRTVPHDATRITCAVDVQGAALYWLVAAWGESFGGDVLAYGVYPDQGRAYFRVGEIQKTMEKAHPSDPWEAALYACLGELVDGILTKEWQLEDGSTMHAGKIIIDASYGRSTDTIHKFCRASRHSALLLPYFGKAIAAGQTPIDEYKKKPGRQVGPGWHIDKPTKRQVRSVLADANAWKSFTADRLLASPGAAASLSLYGSAAAEHRMIADQLSAEIRTRVTANGRTSDQWRVKPNQDNHWLDCLSMAAIGASVLGARLDEKAAARRAAPAPTADQVADAGKPKPDKPPPRIRGARPGGWLGGFTVGGF